MSRVRQSVCPSVARSSAKSTEQIFTKVGVKMHEDMTMHHMQSHLFLSQRSRPQETLYQLDLYPLGGKMLAVGKTVTKSSTQTT